MMALWRDPLVFSEADGVEESKISAEEADLKNAVLRSIVHAINVDKTPLKAFKFESMDECLSFFEECASYGYSINHLNCKNLHRFSYIENLNRLPYYIKVSNLSIEKLIELLQLDLFNNLKSLNLRGNHFGPEEARALAPTLRKLTLLKFLDLRRNGFGSEGDRALAPAFQRLREIQPSIRILASD